MSKKEIKNILTQAFILTLVLLTSCEKEKITDIVHFLKIEEVSPITFSDKGGSDEIKSIKVLTNVDDWKVESSQKWCLVIQTATGFTIEVEPNVTDKERKAVIKVTTIGVEPIAIEVIQQVRAAIKAELDINPKAPITFLAKDNVAYQVEVVTNLEQWSVTSDKAWCHVVKTEKGFIVTADNNMLLEIQSAIITVSGIGVEPILLSVIQAAKSAGNTYSFVIPDFSESNVYKVFAGTTSIAEVVREYLYLENQLDVQVVTVYPTDKSGLADLTKGFVAKITQKGKLDNTKIVGGTVAFDLKNNTITQFTNGNQASHNRIGIDIEKNSINFYTTDEVVNTATLQADRVADIDGNSYPIVKIGTQYWMAENLRTTKYNDGQPILQAPEASQWNKAADNRTGAYCFPQNDPNNKNVYGLLYNGYAMGFTRDMEDLQNDKLSPKGWRIPKGWKLQIDAIYVGTPLAPESDMDRLMRYLQGSKENGASPKMRNPQSWRAKIASNPPYGDNLSLFSASGSGFRSYDLRSIYNDGDFIDFQHIEGWWCSTVPVPKEEGLVHYQVEAASIEGTNVDLNPTYQDKGLGLPIRCLRK